MTRPDWIRASAAVATAAAFALIPVQSANAATGESDEAAATEYVALGDSYSSGVGTRDYIPDSGSCKRSEQAYPSEIASGLGATLNFQACSGATSANVLANQVPALSADTGLVSVTSGGNDAGFTDVIVECAQPEWLSDCGSAIDGAQAYLSDSLPGQLDALYTAIADSSPSARVVVAGYPKLFMGEDCNAGTWFSPEEQTRLNETADLLDDVVAERAGAYGFAFVDVRSAFEGHAVCDGEEWINGLSNPVEESYHPNTLGQDAYGAAVAPALAG